jgi:hypothetical protein
MYQSDVRDRGWGMYGMDSLGRLGCGVVAGAGFWCLGCVWMCVWDNRMWWACWLGLGKGWPCGVGFFECKLGGKGVELL